MSKSHIGTINSIFSVSLIKALFQRKAGIVFPLSVLLSPWSSPCQSLPMTRTWLCLHPKDCVLCFFLETLPSFGFRHHFLWFSFYSTGQVLFIYWLSSVKTFQGSALQPCYFFVFIYSPGNTIPSLLAFKGICTPNDSQIYVSSPDPFPKLQAHIQPSTQIFTWISNRDLKVNLSKIRLLFSRNMLHPSTDNLLPAQCSTSQERLSLSYRSSSDTPHPSVNPVAVTFKILYIYIYPKPDLHITSPAIFLLQASIKFHPLSWIILTTSQLDPLLPSPPTICSQHGGTYLNYR